MPDDDGQPTATVLNAEQAADAIHNAAVELREAVREAKRPYYPQLEAAVGSLLLLIPFAMCAGFTLAWTIALYGVPKGQLPYWPAFAAAAVGLITVPLSRLRANDEAWRRNVQVMQDNILLIVITAGLSFAVSMVTLLLD